MKLLEVVWNFPNTVMQPFDMYYFYWPVREAVERGWEAEVLTFQMHEQQPREEIINGIKIHRCPASNRKGCPLSWDFLHALFTTNADIIHCHGYGEIRSELALVIGRLRGRKVVFTPHFHVYPHRRPLREWYDKSIGRAMFQLSHRSLVFTRYTYQHLRQLGVDAEKISILPHVSRPEVFQESSNTILDAALLSHTHVSGSPLLLGVGQLIKRKGWEHTVRCLPAIVEQFPQAKLLIIGPSQPAEPAFRRHLLQLAHDLGVEQHLQIIQDNPPAFIRAAYRSATLLTHPSFVESFGMVLLEAMTVGLPIIAHNGTGIPCIVEDNITGYTVDVRDTSAYTEALLRVLHNPLLAQRLGQAGQQQALTRYSQHVQAERLFALYAELLGTKIDNNELQQDQWQAAQSLL